MDPPQLAWIAGFIWGIADDVLRDLYVILPMTVLRRLDAVLEPTKQAVLGGMKASLDQAKITNQDQALRQAAGQAFYNTSRFTLRDLRARASQQQLKADFEAHLDGFSPNVQDILDKFEFRNQIPRLSKTRQARGSSEEWCSTTGRLAFRSGMACSLCRSAGCGKRPRRSARRGGRRALSGLARSTPPATPRRVAGSGSGSG